MDATAPADQRALLSADDPITEIAQDRLGRADFARSLGRALGSWRGDQSLIVALWGEWGSGKSSIKNMVLDSFTAIPEAERPQVLEFNPWQFAGQEQLFHAFFREIGTALGHYASPDAARLEKQWRVYEAQLRLTQTFAEAISYAVPAVTALAIAVGVGVFVAPVATVVVAVAFLVALALKWPVAISARIAELLSARSQLNEGVPQAKETVADLLKKRRAPLVVVLDDVDRLQPAEIRLLFQLMKANGDLPRLVYFPLFQEDIVEKSLQTEAQSGRDFLEKIVQVAFSVPVLEQDRLDRVLFESLDGLLDQEGMRRTFDQRRWGNLYLGGLQGYFTTLRRVYRFLSVLRFHAGVLHREGWLEVNVVDLIGLEVLRLYEPAVYERLVGTKRFLTERAARASVSAAPPTEAKAAVEVLIADLPADRKARVSAILTELFPHAAWVFGGSHYGDDWEGTWERELRVGAKEIFDRYFLLTLPQGDLSEAELGRLIAQIGYREALRGTLNALADRGLLVRALERLEAHKEKLPFEHAVSFVGALLDVGDRLPDRPRGMFTTEPAMHAARIVYFYLKQGPAEERGARLVEAVRSTEGFYLPVFIVELEAQAHEKKDAETSVTAEQLEELKRLTVERIEAAGLDGRLIRHWGMIHALFVWMRYAGEQPAKDWFASMLTAATVVPFLRSLVQRSSSQTIADRVSRTRWYMTLSSVETWVPAEQVEKLLAEMDESGLGEEDSRAVETFREAMARRRSGKPDYDPMRSRMEED